MHRPRGSVTPAEAGMVAMAMALPLHAGDRLTSINVSCVAITLPTQIEARIYRTGDQGVDISATNATIGVTPAWMTFTIQDPNPHELLKYEGLSLRVSTPAPVACGNVTVRYEPGAP